MDLRRLLPHPLRRRWIAKVVQPYTLVQEKRIKSLYNLARRVESQKLPGDVIECGVWNGGTAAILAHFATRSPVGRTMWLFDSFQGMPEPVEADGEEAKEWTGKTVGNMDKVLEVLNLVDVDMDRVKIMKGWFEDTFPSASIDRIALLNIDADWFESVKLCLETFYDAVVPAGFISIDDYGHCPGCRAAVDEFFARRGLPFELVHVDYTARWFQKK